MIHNDEVGCATCPTYVCRLGHRDKGPEYCPMLVDFPSMADLYQGRDLLRDTARYATLIEGEGYRKWTRCEEVIELAHRLGVAEVGLAACQDMGLEMDIMARMLSGAGFEVLRGDVVADGQCAPLLQAEYLNESACSLNVLMGMCVGHDALFMKASKGLVTPLVARDSFLHNNPVAALHTHKSYFEGSLYRNHRDASKHPKVGPDTLREAARDPYGPAATALEKIAGQVVLDGAGRWCRMEEFLEFAGRAGVSTVGLIFCSGLREEALTFYKVLEGNGFRVLSIQCKSGAVPKEEMGIDDSQKVRPGSAEMMCNPLAQTEVLNRTGTDLNVLMGQCAGHDAGSIATSASLTVSLVVKDRVLAHNTSADLYRWALAKR